MCWSACLEQALGIPEYTRQKHGESEELKRGPAWYSSLSQALHVPQRPRTDDKVNLDKYCIWEQLETF